MNFSTRQLGVRSSGSVSSSSVSGRRRSSTDQFYPPNATTGGKPDRSVTAGYHPGVQRAAHDRGGWPTDAPIDRAEHELADWELLADALVGALIRERVLTVDELRRGIESMPEAEYERAGYYERWLYSVETILTEKGIVAPGELDQRLAG